MCLISIAPKGTDKYSTKLLEALRTAANTNTDGMGFTYKKNKSNKVYISKGYTKVEDLIKILKKHKLTKFDELVIHQRIGNKGSKNSEMCHPFVVSNDINTILSNDKFVNSPTIVHNGTFLSYSKHGSEYSDTYFFVKDFMYNSDLINLLKNDLNFFKDIFSARLGTNRLCFLFPNEDTDLIKLGEYKEDEGYFFSNESYKNKYLRNVGGYEYSNYDQWGRAYEEDDFEFDFRQSYDKKDFNKNNNEINNKVTKSNEYKSSSILSSDLIISGGVCVECEATHIKHRLFMDMWIPEKYKTSSQFLATRWNPTEFNFADFAFKAIITDEDCGLKIDTYYKMIHFDDSSKEGLHIFIKKYPLNNSMREEMIYIPGYRIPSLFEVSPIAVKIKKYQGYYKLCQQLSASKTTLKRVNKLMDICNANKLYLKNEISFRGINNIPIESMTLFQHLLTKELYKNSYHNKINKRNDLIVI